MSEEGLEEKFSRRKFREAVSIERGPHVSVILDFNGVEIRKGDLVTVKRGGFSPKNLTSGCVVEKLLPHRRAQVMHETWKNSKIIPGFALLKDEA